MHFSWGIFFVVSKLHSNIILMVNLTGWTSFFQGQNIQHMITGATLRSSYQVVEVWYLLLAHVLSDSMMSISMCL